VSAFSLELHHINVMGGDCTVIVFAKDGTPLKRVIIDVGAESHGSQIMSQYLSRYIFPNGQAQRFDYFIASHYHADHVQNMAGLSFTFDRWIDIGGYAVGGQRFDSRTKTASKSQTTYAEAIREHAARAVAPAQRLPLPFLALMPSPDSNTVAPAPAGDAQNAVIIPLDEGEAGRPAQAITMTCVAGAGVIANMLTGSTGTTWRDVLGEQKLDKRVSIRSTKVNDNDASLAFVLEWTFGDQVFKYFTAGDLSGSKARKGYFDIERPLVKALGDAGKIGPGMTVLKLSHHLSEESTYDDGGDESFLARMKPTTMIGTSNQAKHYLPNQTGLERVNSYARSATGQSRGAGFFLVNPFSVTTVNNRDKKQNEPGRWQAASNIRAAPALDHNLREYDFEHNGKMRQKIDNGEISAVVVRVEHEIASPMLAAGARKKRKRRNSGGGATEYMIWPVEDTKCPRGTGAGQVRHEVTVRKAQIVDRQTYNSRAFAALLPSTQPPFRELGFDKKAALDSFFAAQAAMLAASPPDPVDFPAFEDPVSRNADAAEYLRLLLNFFSEFYFQDAAQGKFTFTNMPLPDDWRTFQPILSRFDAANAPSSAPPPGDDGAVTMVQDQPPALRQIVNARKRPRQGDS